MNIAKKYVVDINVHTLDLSDSLNVDRLIDVAGDIDILVNNTGAIPVGSVADVDESRWREAWDLKVYGYINMTRAFLARMTAGGKGVIINDIGMGGKKHSQNLATKTAARNITLTGLWKGLLDPMRSQMSLYS